MKIQQNNGKFLWLESARGIAAILVVLFHTTGIISSPKYYGEVPLAGFFNFGYAGVDFFFVLSGFIIFYIHYRDIGKIDKVHLYFKKRFIRIYPIHWIVLTVFIVGLVLYPSVSFPSLEKIIKSYLLFPLDGYPVNIVAWTLVYEVSFYVLFGILIANKKIGYITLSIWFISVFIGSMFIQDDAGYLQQFIFSMHNLEFCLGMGVASIFRYWNTQKYGSFIGLLGTIFFATGAWLNATPDASTVLLLSLYALGSAFIIYGLVCADLMNKLRQPPQLLVFLGSASYSIYLIHFLVLSIFIKIFLKLGMNNSLPLTINYLALVMVAIAIGSLLHLYIEKPMLRYFRKRYL